MFAYLGLVSFASSSLPSGRISGKKGSEWGGYTYHSAHKRSICPWCTQKAGSPGEVNRSPPGSPLWQCQHADMYIQPGGCWLAYLMT